MEVVNVFYMNGMPPVVSRAIEHDGKLYVPNFGTHYINDKKVTLNQIPPESIERTEPVPDRPSLTELALMKELIERAGKIMVPMLVQVIDHHPKT